jgi:hypothetical protein
MPSSSRPRTWLLSSANLYTYSTRTHFARPVHQGGLWIRLSTYILNFQAILSGQVFFYFIFLFIPNSSDKPASRHSIGTESSVSDIVQIACSSTSRCGLLSASSSSVKESGRLIESTVLSFTFPFPDLRIVDAKPTEGRVPWQYLPLICLSVSLNVFLQAVQAAVADSCSCRFQRQRLIGSS